MGITWTECGLHTDKTQRTESHIASCNTATNPLPTEAARAWSLEPTYAKTEQCRKPVYVKVSGV